MNAGTSGPTPTPAAATVAAYSTSRLIPSRCVSLPASRMTERSGTSATVTRKFRFVIPPLSGVSVRSWPTSSGTRCIAPTRWSRSSPRSSAGRVASSVIRSGAAHAAPQPLLPGWFSSTDDRLARRGIHGHLDRLDLASLSDRVVDGSGQDDRADEGLEDRPRRQPLLDLAADLDERVDERVRPGITQVVPEDAEQARVRPERDVDDHQPAPDQREDVEDRPPAAEREPGAAVRPTPGSREEDAEVAEEVRDIDHPGRPDRDIDRRAGTGDEERDGRKHTDRDGCVRRGSERLVHLAPGPTEWQPSVATHGEHEADGRTLDRQCADVDRDEDDDQVQVAECDPADAEREVLLDRVSDREPERLAGRHRRRDVLEGEGDREQEDRADDARQPDRGQDTTRRLAAGIKRLLAERSGGVEAIDDEQRHEHPDEEDRHVAAVGKVGGVGRVKQDRRRLVVGEEQEDQGEDEHPEDLGADADVVDDRQEPDAEDVDQGGRHQCDEPDERLHVEPRDRRWIRELDLVGID